MSALFNGCQRDKPRDGWRCVRSKLLHVLELHSNMPQTCCSCRIALTTSMSMLLAAELRPMFENSPARSMLGPGCRVWHGVTRSFRPKRFALCFTSWYKLEAPACLVGFSCGQHRDELWQVRHPLGIQNDACVLQSCF